MLVIAFVGLVALLTANLLPALRYGDTHCVAFSPDGKLLACGYEDGSVRIWQLDTGRWRTLAQHSNLVRSLAFSPDGTRLASGSLDTTVRLTEVATGEPVATYSSQTCANGLAFSADGRYLAAGNWDYSVVVWDIGSNAKVATLTGHTNSVSSVAFSKDGFTLFSASEDRTSKLWDTTSWTEDSTLDVGGRVTAMAYWPDASKIAFARELDGVSIWNIEDNEEHVSLRGESERLSSMAISNDATMLATGSAWENIHSIFPGNIRFRIMKRPSFAGIKLWNLETATEKKKIPSRATIWSVAFSPDGKLLAGSSENWVTSVWDVDDPSKVRTFVAHRPFRLVILYVIGLAVVSVFLILQTYKQRNLPEE